MKFRRKKPKPAIRKLFLILKNFADFLLKRKIIRAGHFDNAGILNQKMTSEDPHNQEANKYPSLKGDWSLFCRELPPI